jgi:ribosomal protein L40E
MKRIRSLVLALLTLAIAAPVSGQGRPNKYVGATKCRSCHKKEGIGNQYGVWLESKHAKALETLASDQAKEWAAEAGVEDPQTADECVKCHVTAHGVAKERLGLKFKQSEGVTCEACHGAGSGYRKKKTMERYTRPDGTKVGFDYDQAVETIAHPVPEGYDATAEGEAD